MRVSSSLPTGVEALLFDNARRRRQLETRLVAALEDAEFSEVVLPVVDYLAPYETLLSERSRNELYRFVDRDGEVLALRADFTPMLARLIAPRLASLPLPLRLFYRGDVLRYRQERLGQHRELYQVGGEVLGLPGEQAEDEVLRQFLTMLNTAQVARPRVVLGLAGALDALLASAGDGSGALAAAMVRRERRAARSAHPALLEVVEQGRPADSSVLGPEAAARLTRLVAQRDTLARAFPDLALDIDLAEFADQAKVPSVRRQLGGQAYYDGLIFRAFGSAGSDPPTDADAESGRSNGGSAPVGAGGRYDGLFQTLGADVTAAGFTLSLDPLVSLSAAGESP